MVIDKQKKLTTTVKAFLSVKYFLNKGNMEVNFGLERISESKNRFPDLGIFIVPFCGYFLTISRMFSRESGVGSR